MMVVDDDNNGKRCQNILELSNNPAAKVVMFLLGRGLDGEPCVGQAPCATKADIDESSLLVRNRSSKATASC